MLHIWDTLKEDHPNVKNNVEMIKNLIKSMVNRDIKQQLGLNNKSKAQNRRIKYRAYLKLKK